MKRRLLTLALSILTIGLLGSCSKINERIDGLDQRVGNIENEKIASIENQIAAINSSIADLSAIREDITDLQAAVGAKGEDISELKAADEALGQRIDELKAYVGDLSRFAEKDWVTATFATLEQLEATNTALSALQEKVNKLSAATDTKIAGLKTELTNAIDSAISGINATISTLEGRVAALEQMIKSVSITPAYSDGSVEAVDGILTLKCIVRPAEALTGMQSLKDSLLIFADSVKVKTKAASAYMEIKVSEATVTDAKQGAITLKADISEYLPKGEDKALTVALNVKNGISDFTTEFVPVSAVIGPAAKIGETTYATLAEAIEAVENNETITLLKDITDAVGIAINKSFTLDFDGHTYTVGGPGAGTPATAAFDIAQGSIVTFKNGTICSPEDNKSKTGTEGISTIIRNNGNGLTLENINIDGANLAKDGDNYGTLIVNSGQIQSIKGGSYTNDGPVLVSEFGIVSVGGSEANKVTFTSNKSTTIIVKKSYVTLDDGVYTGAKGVVSFSGNEAPFCIIEITAGTYNSADYPVLWGDKNGKNNKVTVKGGTFNATATGENVPCGIFSPGDDEIIVTGGIFNVPGEDASAAGGTGITVLKGKLTVEEEVAGTLKFNVGKTEGRGKVLDIEVKRGYSIAINKNYGEPVVTADTEKYPQGIVATEKTLAEILGDTTGIPESQDLTAPENAWMNSTDSDCKAFIGKDGGNKYFVIKKEGSAISLLVGMNEAFEKIDDNTYQKVVNSIGTVTVKMTEGKFTSYIFEAVDGSDYAALNGTYGDFKCDVEVKFYYVSELLPDSSSQFPDHSALAYTITSQSKNVTSVKIAMGKKYLIDGFLESGKTLEQIALEYSNPMEQNKLADLNADGSYTGIFAPLDPSFEYEIIVLASNSYGQSALAYDVKATADAPSYTGELVIGDYTITDAVSLDGGTSEQTFTVISKDGTDSNISIKNLANDDNIEWYATYNKDAHTLTLDGSAYGYEQNGSIFLYTLYSVGSYSAGYLAGNTGSDPIVFSVDPTTHQISGLQTDYALFASNGSSIIGYFKYFAAGIATIVKGDGSVQATSVNRQSFPAAKMVDMKKASVGKKVTNVNAMRTKVSVK